LTDGLYRENSFFEASWTCLKCDDGYGLAENGAKCMPCPDPCITCYKAQANSCLTKKIIDDGKKNQTNTTNTTTGCQGYVDYVTK